MYECCENAPCDYFGLEQKISSVLFCCVHVFFAFNLFFCSFTYMFLSRFYPIVYFLYFFVLGCDHLWPPGLLITSPISFALHFICSFKYYYCCTWWCDVEINFEWMKWYSPQLLLHLLTCLSSTTLAWFTFWPFFKAQLKHV